MKVFNNITQINNLICREQTGNSYEFAEKIGISRSCIFNYFRFMRNEGLPIMYCRFKRTYYYAENGKYKFGFYHV